MVDGEEDRTDATGELRTVGDAMRFAPSRPGVVVIARVGAPTCLPHAVGAAPQVIGRRDGDLILADEAISRSHLRVSRAGDGLLLQDLGSRHGTKLDGERIVAPTEARPGALVQIGHSLLLVVADVGPFERRGVTLDAGYVVGPAHAAALDAVRDAAADGCNLLVQGESGSGKEHAARVYHAASGRAAGPLVIANMATLPADLAEAILFGARKGAYTGSHGEQIGLFAQAHGGTLFLDEIGELAPALQAKLLRAVEEKRIRPLGASCDQAVDVRIVSATWRDLAACVDAGHWREDLRARLSQEHVRLPPLRERREEIPWLVDAAILDACRTRGRPPLGVHPSLVIACAERLWPGQNVRGLFNAVRAAARAAMRAGSTVVEATHLPPPDRGDRAPERFAEPTPTTVTGPGPAAPPKRALPRKADLRREAIRESWVRHGGDWKKVAEEHGVSRTTVFDAVKDLR